MTRIILTGPLLILCTQIETSILCLKMALFCICRFHTFFVLQAMFSPSPFFWQFQLLFNTKIVQKCLLIMLKVRRKSESAVIKPVGEVFLPRRSGTLSSSLCKHQRISYWHNCRPRSPRVQCLCGFSHRLLQCDVRGANPLSCCHAQSACRLHHQWLLGLNTLHH